MKLSRLLVSLCLIALANGICSKRAAAAIFCVDTPATLQTAINAAQNNNEDNEIHLVQGNYALTATLTYGAPYYRAIAFRGGYAAGCNVLQRQLKPSNTIVDGQSVAGRYISITSLNGIVVEGLTIRNFSLQGGGALQLDGLGSGDAYVELRDNIISAAVSNSSAVYVRPSGGGIITNNLVTGNTAPNGIYIDAYSAARRVIVSHNTVATNSAVGVDIVAGLRIPVVLSSNILWGNAGTDLKGENYAFFALSNTIGTQSLQAPFAEGSVGNNATNPQLDATFHPTAASLSIVNTGSTFAAGIPAFELDGNTRTIGSAPDRGVYEYATNDYTGHTYTVSSTSDSGAAGTLRNAIVQANAAGVPARITFNVGCAPALITLNSVLPDIQVPLKIDGYSQAGSARNTQANGFNGKLCVALVRGGTTAYALRVAAASPNGRLEVSGLVFSFFPGSAIALSDGTGHVIRGNSFGVQVPPNGAYPGTGAVFGNGAALTASAAAFAATIGGQSPGDRNLIGNGAAPVGYGVNLSLQSNEWGLHTVQGNFIGMAADGLASAGNFGDGVSVFASGYDEISDNLIGSNGGSGIAIAGNNSVPVLYSLVQRNIVGEDLAGNAEGNSVAGISITGAASNTVGNGAINGNGIGNRNRIGGNLGPGIWIDSSANPINSNGNFVAINDFDANAGLAIDLDTLGPLDNDPGDADSGANSRLNKPTVTSALVATPGELELSATFSGKANVQGKLHFYYSAACDVSGFGPGSVYLGPAPFTTDAQGNVNVTVRLTASVAEGGVISATAGNGADTSEFGNCQTLMKDYLFENGFDP